MKTKKAVRKQVHHAHKLHMPRKALKIRTEAKKGGVTAAVVNRLMQTASKQEDHKATPFVHTARLLARGKFRRAYKLAAKNPLLASVRPVIARGLKTLNPRFYAKHVAA